MSLLSSALLKGFTCYRHVIRKRTIRWKILTLFNSYPHEIVNNEAEAGGLLTVPAAGEGPKLRRSQSRAFLSEDGMPQPIEFFVASDASAVIEHTKRVLYLEDDDIAHIHEGGEFRVIFRWSSHAHL